jgi:hypothetical protein
MARQESKEYMVRGEERPRNESFPTAPPPNVLKLFQETQVKFRDFFSLTS